MILAEPHQPLSPLVAWVCWVVLWWAVLIVVRDLRD